MVDVYERALRSYRDALEEKRRLSSSRAWERSADGHESIDRRLPSESAVTYRWLSVARGRGSS